MKRSKKYSVGIRDFINGAVVSVFPTLLVALQTWSSDMPVDWMLTCKIMVSTFALYVFKNYFENSNGQIHKSE